MSKTANSLAPSGAADYFLRIQDDSVFGPVPLPTLCEWAEQGRVAPGNHLSADRENWIAAEDLPALQMNWMVELPDGELYGPLTMKALRELVNDGTIAADARIVKRGQKLKKRKPTPASPAAAPPTPPPARAEPAPGPATAAPADKATASPPPAKQPEKKRRPKTAAPAAAPKDEAPSAPSAPSTTPRAARKPSSAPSNDAPPAGPTRDEFDELMRMNAGLTKKLELAERKRQALDTHGEEGAAEKAELERKAAELLTEKNALRKEVGGLKARLTKAAAASASTEVSRETLETELVTTRTQHRRLERDTEARLEQAHKALAESEAARDKSAAAAAAADSQLNLAIEARDDMERAGARRVAELEGRVATLQNEMPAVRESLGAERVKLQEMGALLSDRERELTELHKLYGMMLEERTSQQTEHATATRDLRKRLQAATDELRGVRRELDTSGEEAHQRICSLERERDAFHDEQKRGRAREKEVARLRRREDEFKQQVAALKKRLATRKKAHRSSGLGSLLGRREEAHVVEPDRIEVLPPPGSTGAPPRSDIDPSAAALESQVQQELENWHKSRKQDPTARKDGGYKPSRWMKLD